MRDESLHDRKVELLRNMDIFSRLREYELDIIARQSEMVNFKKGQAVFSLGSTARELYVVDTGRVGIMSMENESDVNIAQIVPGESFGELDFLGRTTRNAGAFAEEDSMLLRFPSHQHKDDVFKSQAYISAQMLYRLLGIVSERIWNVKKHLYDKTGWLRSLHKQLLRDSMTGLYNRSYLEEDFVNLLPDVGSSAALVMIKPDNFKDINDQFGHEAGDQVLTLMAIFLQSELDENDIGVRYRGDEFAAILTNTGKEDAIQRAKEISATYKSMDLKRITGGQTVKIQVSIGVALYPLHADNSRELLDRAYRKMMQARNAGGNRISI